MTLNADNIGQYVSDLEAKVRALEQWKEGAVNVEKFYASRMSVSEVARLHHVDSRTVQSHADRGAIEKHPDSTDERTYIRGSVALTLNFKQLRKESRRH